MGFLSIFPLFFSKNTPFRATFDEKTSKIQSKNSQITGFMQIFGVICQVFAPFLHVPVFFQITGPDQTGSVLTITSDQIHHNDGLSTLFDKFRQQSPDRWIFSSLYRQCSYMYNVIKASEPWTPQTPSRSGKILFDASISSVYNY